MPAGGVRPAVATAPPSVAPAASVPAGATAGGAAHVLALCLRAGVLVACLVAVALLLQHDPFGRLDLAAAVAVYGLALCWRPNLWLFVIPMALPAWNLAPWTGWLYLSGPDLFLLVTIGVLAWRAPPQRTDFLLRGMPGAVLLLACFACTVGVLRGLTVPDAVPGGSSNPYLQPENALRLAKGFLVAMALLPFLRARQRSHGDVPHRFAWGMIAGLGCVSVATILERALFPGLFDFSVDYRVVA